MTTTETQTTDIRYLKLLSQKFPTIFDACSEIINLEAILNLPKGTEHFLTDLHGEYEAFQHVLRNASGVIKRKVNDIFGNSLRESEKTSLCTLIYYPEQKMELVRQSEKDINDWYCIALNRLVEICRNVSSKYTRSKVRKALPTEFAYIIEELLHESSVRPNKHDYFNGIIKSIISTGRAEDFIAAICNLIQHLTIDSLHIIGDIYDRGPGAHLIMDRLCAYHHVDVQWGNHDMLWMGAAAGNECCIANVVRISTRYANLETLEDGYGINLLPLATFAIETYGNDPCEAFKPRVGEDNPYKEKTLKLMSQMHKAIAIIQFKLEHEISSRREEFGMERRSLLGRIDFNSFTIELEGKLYALHDTNFPTVNPKDPYRLSDEERELVAKLRASFLNSEKLEKHIRCLYSKGSMYLVRNSNLLFHASIPMNPDGSFASVVVEGEVFKGRALMDRIDRLVRTAYFDEDDSPEKRYALDYMWYLWCGPYSPLFGKDKMATFERYFIEEKQIQAEVNAPYYALKNMADICDRIMEEFGLDPEGSHIINGHTPVKTTRGEKPMRAAGKLLVIDGGFSRTYQPETGIAGYTLIYNSYGLQLVQHEPFQSMQKAIGEGKDIISTRLVIEYNVQRKSVRDTDIGCEISAQVQDLKMLLAAYRSGLIKEVK